MARDGFSTVLSHDREIGQWTAKKVLIGDKGRDVEKFSIPLRGQALVLSRELVPIL